MPAKMASYMNVECGNADTPFTENGYDIIPAFVEPHELNTLSTILNEALSSPRHSGMSRPGNDLLPLRWNDDIIAHLLRSERRLSLLRALLAPRDLKWLSGYVSTKRPNSPALWWHQDWWCWDHPVSFRRPAPQVAVLCYFTDTDARNGALRVLAGSHHRSLPIHALLPEPHASNDLPDEHAAATDCEGQATLSLRAGDAVVLDYRLLHGTHANRTSQRRDCVLLSFIPAWRDLPDEIRAHLIAHPALPDASEDRPCGACEYVDLVPRFSGTPASLPINRLPPARFAVQH